MHYIRFLKSPKLVSQGASQSLVAKITITTDLGESFLAADLGVCVDVVGNDGESLLGNGERKEYLWKGSQGMRSLEVSVDMRGVRKVERVKMCVSAMGDACVDSFEVVLGLTSTTSKENGENEGGVVTVRSMEIDLRTGQTIGSGLAERVFISKIRKQEIHIWEETGESIARHVWDAGLVLSSYIASIPHISTSTTLPRLLSLENTLLKPNLNILELGAGCGIVGITIHHVLQNVHILLTDLPEASEILSHNLSPSILSRSPSESNITHQILDWYLPLPSNVSSTSWDLVMVADCTYNPDVVPDLVRTLGRIAVGNSKVEVCVAMKVRHESEVVFFSLMGEEGFVVKERAVLPLLVLGGEAEEIEVFVFGFEGERREGYR